MSRKHCADLSINRLESKVALSSITPAVAIHHLHLAAQVSHLEGAVQGTYTSMPGPTAAFLPMQLQGGGAVSPLGAVGLNGTIAATGSELTLRGVTKNVVETLILHEQQVVKTPTGLVETFSYQTTDGLYRGTFVIDLHAHSSLGTTPSRLGTFDAEFC